MRVEVSLEGEAGMYAWVEESSKAATTSRMAMVALANLVESLLLLLLVLVSRRMSAMLAGDEVGTCFQRLLR